MKRVVAVFFCLIMFVTFSYSYGIVNKTLKVGETITIASAYNDVNPTLLTGDAIAVELLYQGYIRVTGLKPGYASFTGGIYRDIYTFHVIGVTDINIPDNISLTANETYKFKPIISDSEATTTLTWTSDNSAVATVNPDGTVKAIGIGRSTITCRSENGVSAQSVVSVSPLLAQSISVSQKSAEMVIGENLQLTSTIIPANVTSSMIKWMSTNENIAQVDDEGTVTAIGPGYCSIYSLADDGSGKFDKCLIHVQGTNTAADINGNGKVDIGDAVMIVNFIVGKAESLTPTN